jgi:hypothetical protein
MSAAQVREHAAEDVLHRWELCNNRLPANGMCIWHEDAMKPERRVFIREAGQYIESELGTARECYYIEPERQGMTLHRIWMDLRRDHGPDVDVGKNLELDLVYIISARPDGRFTPHQASKIGKVYRGIITALPVAREGDVIKGPWQAQGRPEAGEDGPDAA